VRQIDPAFRAARRLDQVRIANTSAHQGNHRFTGDGVAATSLDVLGTRDISHRRLSASFSAATTLRSSPLVGCTLESLAKEGRRVAVSGCVAVLTST